uniref:Tetraspanin 7 n=1 Tax=Oncorhynchus tshawytscha TaxID=74940 RepID=A0AAZ3RSV5_ONCTS
LKTDCDKSLSNLSLSLFTLSLSLPSLSLSLPSLSLPLHPLLSLSLSLSPPSLSPLSLSLPSLSLSSLSLSLSPPLSLSPLPLSPSPSPSLPLSLSLPSLSLSLQPPSLFTLSLSPLPLSPPSLPSLSLSLSLPSLSLPLHPLLSLQLKCCGVLNYTSWFSSIWFPNNGIPPSCCASISDCNASDLHNVTIAPSKVHQQGCYELVTDFIETNMGIIAGVTFGIAVSQSIGMLLACCLSRLITANQYEMV